tara:strand:- start:4571 stop:5176 length:606 start_codon:yes stop_codon:yes gene_type:complete
MNKLRIIRIIIKASMGLLILGMVFVTIFFASMKEGVFIEIEQPHWVIRSDSLQEVLRSQLPVPDKPMLLSVETLEMMLPVHLNLRLIVIAMMFMVSGYMLWILWLIATIIHDVMKGTPFNLSSSKRVKLIGTLVVLAPLGEWTLNVFFSFWIDNRFHFEGMILETDANLGWPVFILGLLIVVLGVAFEQGQKIQEENELTI